MKFAHISDSHLGGWRQPELQSLNLASFRKTIDICIEERVDFVLFTGDLFDSAFPPIDILKETFAEFRRLKDSQIKAYIIAGSHDYSVSGKTFLDVLEKSGFCEICKYETDENKNIILKPIVNQSVYIYGYPGKKSGLELEDLKRIVIKEPYSEKFRILMLHTTISDVVEGMPIDSISLLELPKADYYALGHVHIDYKKDIEGRPVVYGGPTFPNNFKEFEELGHGAFYIIDVGGFTKVTKKELKIKDVELIEVELDDALKGTEKILEAIENKNLRDKIVLLKVFGNLKQGKLSDIKFQEIEDYLRHNGVYSFLKNTSKLDIEKQVLAIQLQSNEMEKIEEVLFKRYDKENPSNFNDYIFPLVESLSTEKQEGETEVIFINRLISGLNKVLKIDLI